MKLEEESTPSACLMTRMMPLVTFPQVYSLRLICTGASISSLTEKLLGTMTYHAQCATWKVQHLS